MAAGRIVLPPYFPARDRNARLVSGALLSVYTDNTTDKAAIYSDIGLTTPRSNPVEANSSGHFPAIYCEAGTADEPVLYSLAVCDADGRSIGNPAYFTGWQPSLDANTAVLALIESAAADAEAYAEAVAAAYADILAIEASGSDAAAIGARAAKAANLSDLASPEAAKRNLGDFATVALAEEQTVPAVLTTIVTKGYAEAGDGGGGTYKRSASQPSHPGKLQTADGQWWELVSEALVDARRFGVVLDDAAFATANTTALQNAIDYCQAIGGAIGVVIPGSMSFAAQITNPALVPIIGYGVLTFTGSGEDAIVLGESPTRTIPSRDLVIPSVINVERATLSHADQFAGIVVQNAANFILHFSADNFYIGLDHKTTGSSSHYSKFYPLRVNRCKIGVRIWADSAAINECNWYGGEFQSTLTTDCVGVQFRKDAGANIINNHKFWGPSFELSSSGTGSCFEGYSADGETEVANNIIVVGARCEGTDFILAGDGIVSSTFGFSRSGTAAVLGTDILNPLNAAARLRLMSNTFDFSNDGPYGWGSPKKLGEVGRQHIVGQTPGGTLLATKPARGCIYIADPTYKFVFHSASVTMKHASVGVASAAKVIFGMLFDLRTAGEDYNRRIVVKAHTVATGGRIAAVCYDASFNRLEDAAGTAGHCSLTWSASTGLYRQGGDMTAISNETDVLFGPDVAYVILGVGPGSAIADFKRIEYFAPSGVDIGVCYDPEAVTGIGITTVNSVAVAPILDTDDALATQAPTEPVAGNSEPVGKRARNPDPAAGESQGWSRGATWVADPAVPIVVTATVDPASLATGASTTTATVAVTGAALGNVVTSSFSLSLAGIQLVAWVSASNVVSYYFINNNGTNPLDIASGTLTVRVHK